MTTVTISIDGVERDCYVEAETWHPAEPDVGIPSPYAEDYTVYHWTEPREFTSEEYGKISEADDNMILEKLDEVGPPGPDPDAARDKRIDDEMMAQMERKGST